MSQTESKTRRLIRWLGQSWHAPVLLAIILLIGFGLWLMPRRIEQIVPVGGSDLWDSTTAPPRRQIIWNSAQQIDAFPKGEDPSGQRFAGHFADGGMTLYFNRSTADGSEIYRSQSIAGNWSTAQSIEEINTPADEIRPVVSADGQRLYFYSNRPGGLGGYDIYVSERSGDRWSSPRNLGPRINTEANELEPAIAPDGCSLYFSSDRNIETDQPRKNVARDIDAWSNTLRSETGVSDFDLFVARRDSSDSQWQDASAIVTLNRADSNEGAPAVAPNGAFLYFASNRPDREDEPANLDLYRSRIIGIQFQEPENLGPSINSESNETEPALSPEGFRLVFSSDRDGVEKLYVSTAEEVFTQFSWDNSRLSSVSGFWWQSIGITLALSLIVGLVLYFRGWIVEKATTAKFFFCSVVIHVLIILVLMKWMLPRVIQEIVTKLHEADPSTQLFDDNQHQSHEDGQEAYEKIADLKSLEPVDPADLIRQVTDPISMPQRTENPIPQISAERARRLPAKDVLFIPPKKQVVAPQQPTSEPMPVDRRKSAPLKPIEVAELSEPPPFEEVAKPAETPVERRDSQLNREATESVPRRPNQQSEPPSPLKRVTELNRVTSVAKVDFTDSKPDLSRSNRPIQQVAVVEPDQEVPSPAAETSPVVEPLESVTTSLPRSILNPLNRPKDTNSPLPRSIVKPSEIVVEAAESSEPSIAENATGTESNSKLVRNAAKVPIVGVAVTETEPASLTANESPAELLVEKAETAIIRAEPISPKPGLGANADLPRQSSAQTAASRPVEVAVADIVPRIDPADVDATALANRQKAATVPQAVEVGEQIAFPAPTKDDSKESQQPMTDRAAELATLERVTSEAPMPNRPDSTPDSKKLPTRSVTASAVVRSKPMADEEQSKPSTLPSQLNRAAGATQQKSDLVQSVTEAETELAASELPNEQPVNGVEVALNRADVQVPVAETRTPKELTGPASRTTHRIVVGSLNEKRYDAPPTFGQHVSRLNRRRAKATRVLMAEDNVGLQSLFTLRQGDTRKQYIELFGGTNDSEVAVDRGLLWLVTHQNPDGSWSLENFHANCKGKHANCPGAGKMRSNAAATGLALLPLLAAGHTHQEGHYKKAVADGLKWLAEHQKGDGNLLGPGDKQTMYSHGIASIALCEACGMTDDPELKEVAAKALAFIVKAQHAGSGGWRYNPNESGDTSVVGWQMMALKSGEMAGIPVPKQTFDNTAKWLKSVEGNQPVGGQFAYNSRGASPAMTAEGLLCLQFMGTERNSPRMRAGADYLMRHLPRPDQKNTSYYWYYATQVMYHMQGPYWDAWNEKLRDELVKSQLNTGQLAGTWHPRDNWENTGGRIYATSMKLLMLEVYYRHLPLYEQLDD